MKYVKQQSYQISETGVTSIMAKDCFKVKVRNDSPGPITVNGLVIESQREETYNDLPPDCVFEEDFDLDATDSNQPLIFVTRYFYSSTHCPA